MGKQKVVSPQRKGVAFLLGAVYWSTDEYHAYKRGGSDVDSETQQVPSASSPPSFSWKSEIKYWVKWLTICGILVFGFRYFVFTVYVVNGESMLPNLVDNERIVINKWIYDVRQPQRGEIIVFQATETEQYIKRVIALPGETVEVIGDTLLINGKAQSEPYLQAVIDQVRANGGTYNMSDSEPLKVPAGTLFVLGDNRSNSTDSRILGMIDQDKVIGRADYVLWPLSEMGSLTDPYNP